MAFINFTYESPYKDIEKYGGFYPDGSINVKYTLLAMRNLLQDNIDVINKLLDKSDNIVGIVPYDNGSVEIKTNSTEVLENFANDNIIKLVGASDIVPDYEISETNQDRLNMVNNMVSLNDILDLDTNDNSDSSDGSSNGSENSACNIIFDDNNLNLLIDKYKNSIFFY